MAGKRVPLGKQHISPTRFYNVQCDKTGCHRTESLLSADGYNEVTAARHLADQGWISEGGTILCPYCAKGIDPNDAPWR